MLSTKKIVFMASALFFLMIQTSGCAKSPWRVERYVKRIGIPSIPGELPNSEEYSQFFVKGAFVDVILTGTNETTTSGTGPYILVVNVDGTKNEHKSIEVHGISVISKTGKSFDVSPKLFQKKLFGPSIYGDQMPEFVTATIKSDYVFDFDFDNEKNISVVVDISIENMDGKIERAKVTHAFISELKTGRFLFLSH